MKKPILFSVLFMYTGISFFKPRQLLATTILVFSFTCHSIGQYTAASDSSKPIEHKPSGVYKTVTAKSFVVPGVLITLGALSIHSNALISNEEMKEERDEYFVNFHTSIDNYLQFAPIAAGYGILLGSKNHRFWPYTKKVLLSEAIMLAMVYPAKQLVGEERPDNSAANSFPSGHTAQAFAGATIFCDEFAQHKFWLKTTVYAGAASIGVFRVMNNRHWAGDVVAGAGFGILSAKLTELILEPHGKRKYTTASL